MTESSEQITLLKSKKIVMTKNKNDILNLLNELYFLIKKEPSLKHATKDLIIWNINTILTTLKKIGWKI